MYLRPPLPLLRNFHSENERSNFRSIQFQNFTPVQCSNSPRNYARILQRTPLLPSSPFPRENNRNGRSRGGSSNSSSCCVLVSIDHASLPPDNFHLSLFVDKNLATRSFRVSKTLETEKSSAKKRREKEK